ncbi:unnamed protein product [Clonostachys solani]|uniref:Uncharacterized protein n=1 Tax=Clonostachys solani TaxID=160281 RepID=A0A9P0EJC4_9HYPO|nr:unnamed protein product [Clonostachys solani]
MVCIKQVSIPAVVLLSLAEQAVAAPVARRGDIAVRDAAQADGSIDLAIRDLELHERNLLTKVLTPIVKVTKAVTKNKGKTFDRLLSTANTGMTIANTNKAQKGKRDLEELDERDIEEEIILALRDLGLDERSIFGVVKKAAKAVGSVVSKNKGKTFDRVLSTANTGMAKAAKAVGSVVSKNKGKTFDRVLSTANTGMAVANTHKTQKGKRDLEELDERDIEEEIILALRDLGLDERSIFGVVKKAAKAVGSVVSKNKGKTFDRVLSTANTGMAKAAKAVGSVVSKNKGKTFDRVLSTANTGMAVANTHKTQTGKRDLEDIEERDWEDIEERDVDELDERDWEDVEERDVEELDERVAKGVGHVITSVSNQQGKSYNRANAAANSAMQVAQTKKKQEKRDFEERDFDYLNSLSQRDLEDLELVVRALYGDYLEDY